MLKHIGVLGAIAAVSFAGCSTRVIEREVVHTPAPQAVTVQAAPRSSAHSGDSGHGTASCTAGGESPTRSIDRRGLDSRLLELLEQSVRLGGRAV